MKLNKSCFIKHIKSDVWTSLQAIFGMICTVSIIVGAMLLLVFLCIVITFIGNIIGAFACFIIQITFILLVICIVIGIFVWYFYDLYKKCSDEVGNDN